jgi:serine/threonine-protein kinase
MGANRAMSLPVGSRVGPYEIVASIGAGGMGEVYRARDSRLKRDVALKVLPSHVAASADRLARFQREAELLAALNHPHIAQVHGFEEDDSVRALVMELIDGEDLAARLARGPLPLDEALSLAHQIAEALEAAHDHGIVHRDLKPANIMVTRTGCIKVLDFGLAKGAAAGGGAGSDAADPSAANSPTLTAPTQMGVILGTAAYMAPEQAKGKAVDRRADIWAFGAVLFEMLTGTRAFAGADISDTLAAVLRQEIDWSALPSATPISVRIMLARCLERDARRRLRDIGEARIVLEDPAQAVAGSIAQSGSAVASRARPTAWRRAWSLGLPLLGIAALLVALLIARRVPDASAEVTRLPVGLSQAQQFTLSRLAVAVAPDGRSVAFAADDVLYLRSLDDFTARAISGTNGAINPAFSPDGQSLVFWADSGVKRIAITGGTPVTICAVVPAPANIAWSGDAILFTPQDGTVMQVPAKGGTPQVLVDAGNDVDLILTPQMLPNQQSILFTIARRAGALEDPATATPRNAVAPKTVVQSLATGARKIIHEGGLHARYLPTGHLAYFDDGTLLAAPFDVERLEVVGPAVPVIEGVRGFGVFGSGVSSAHWAVSEGGTLVYVPGPVGAGEQFMFFDAQGAAEPLGLPSGRFAFPRISPDGKRVAFNADQGGQAAVFIYELSDAIAVRRVTYGGNNRFPVWSADGQRISFQSDRDGDRALFWQMTDGGQAERLTRPAADVSHVPESWSPDGRVLLFSETKRFESSLWRLNLDDRTIAPVSEVRQLSLPPHATFSPDGRWFAYQVGTQGFSEGTTYVEPFPPTGIKHQIGRGGRPMWSRDGKQLFFVPSPGRFMVVSVTTQPSFAFSTPRAVRRGFGISPPASPRMFDITPDGRILGLGTRSADASPAPQLHVVVNWFEELKQKVPVQ